MLRSRICEVIGIRYPVFQGGMAWIADGTLAAAVSNGGGLGVVLLQWDDEDKKGNKEQVRFEFTGNVTTSVGRDYKNTSFYGGFRMRSRDHFVGLGFRFMKSRDDVMPNYKAFVVSIGI